MSVERLPTLKFPTTDDQAERVPLMDLNHPDIRRYIAIMVQLSIELTLLEHARAAQQRCSTQRQAIRPDIGLGKDGTRQVPSPGSLLPRCPLCGSVIRKSPSRRAVK
jgi:hypothetical protein